MSEANMTSTKKVLTREDMLEKTLDDIRRELGTDSIARLGEKPVLKPRRTPKKPNLQTDSKK
jgi:hypothetical protein